MPGATKAGQLIQHGNVYSGSSQKRAHQRNGRTVGCRDRHAREACYGLIRLKRQQAVRGAGSPLERCDHIERMQRARSGHVRTAPRPAQARLALSRDRWHGEPGTPGKPHAWRRLHCAWRASGCDASLPVAPTAAAGLAPSASPFWASNAIACDLAWRRTISKSCCSSVKRGRVWPRFWGFRCTLSPDTSKCRCGPIGRIMLPTSGIFCPRLNQVILLDQQVLAHEAVPLG